MTPITLFCLLSIAMASWSPLYIHMVAMIVFSLSMESSIEILMEIALSLYFALRIIAIFYSINSTDENYMFTF